MEEKDSYTQCIKWEQKKMVQNKGGQEIAIYFLWKQIKTQSGREKKGINKPLTLWMHLKKTTHLIMCGETHDTILQFNISEIWIWLLNISKRTEKTHNSSYAWGIMQLIFFKQVQIKVSKCADKEGSWNEDYES